MTDDEDKKVTVLTIPDDGPLTVEEKPAPKVAKPEPTESKVIDFRVPLPPYPEELTDLPGTLGLLTSFIHGRMSYPQPNMAGFLAFSYMSAFVQAKVTINSLSGLGFNEQYLLLMPTGSGKEEARRPLEVLFNRTDQRGTNEATGTINCAEPDTRLHYAAPASMQGIHALLEECRSVVFMSDEFSAWMAASRTNTNKAEALAYLMQIYTKALSSVHPGFAVSTKYKDVANPRLTVLASNTAEAMYPAMTKDDGEAGAFNRWVILHGEETLPKKRYEGLIYEPSQILLDEVRALRKRTGVVSYTKLGFKRWMELDDSIAEPIKREDALLGGRLGEQAIKMAALIALAQHRTQIQPEDVEMAFAIREGLYRRQRAALEGFGGLGGQHETVKAKDQLTEAFKRHRFIYQSQLQKNSRAYEKLDLRNQQLVEQVLISEGAYELEGRRCVSLIFGTEEEA